MANLTKPQYRLVTIASILGILQGIAWFVMSLICIILYFDTGAAPSWPTNPMELFNVNVYNYLLNKKLNLDTILNPTSFLIFMWIYLFSDLFLVVLSLLQVQAINKTGSNPLNVMKSWGVLMTFISFLDFLLVVLIGADYDVNCNASCVSLMIPVLVIAARGFVLWIVNVIFVYVIYRIIKTLKTGKNLDRKLLTLDRQLPRATIQPPSNVPKSPQNDTTDNMQWSNNQSILNRAPNPQWLDNQRKTAYGSSNSQYYTSPQPSSGNGNNIWNNPRSSNYEPRNPSNTPIYMNPQQPSYGRY